MDQTLIDKVSSTIYVKHPDFRGVKPKITNKTDDQFLLLFKQNQKTATGMDIAQVIRVTVDKQGNILKISSSRG